jgi:hypothetical protein
MEKYIERFFYFKYYENSKKYVKIMTQTDNRDINQSQTHDKIKFFVNNLKTLKDKIESVSMFHQIEILRIFKDNNVCITENKNGIFINLTYVDSAILDKVYKYLNYVNKQEDQLNEIEEEKQKIVTSFFS